MTVAEWLAIIPAGGISGIGGKLLYDFLQARFFSKSQAPTPMQVIVGDTSGGRRTSSSDKLRALSEDTAERVQSLHKALARENPETGGYVILENMTATNRQLERQTAILAGVEKNLESQTSLLERLVAATEQKKLPLTRY